jgi:hypothetical protein
LRVFIDANLLVYLNVMSDDEERGQYERFLEGLLSSHRLFTDDLVLDELLYVSKKKYGIPYGDTVDFTSTIILPFVGLLNLGEQEFTGAASILMDTKLKPSDALHLSAMRTNKVPAIATEDKDYDEIKSLKRLWLSE